MPDEEGKERKGEDEKDKKGKEMRRDEERKGGGT